MGKAQSRHSEHLHSAVVTGNKAKILKLLRKNVNLKAVYDHGNTVLHLALQNIRSTPDEIIDMLNIFIFRGVDPNVKNHRNETVLHLAIARRDTDIIEFLLDHNAQVNVTDSKGNTIAHMFIECELDRFINHVLSNCGSRKKIEEDGISFVEWMLSKGFDFDVKNNEGLSAMHWAIGYNLQHILPSLLKKTKYINFKTNAKGTLLHSFIIACNELQSDKSWPKYLNIPSSIWKLELSPKYYKSYRLRSDNFSKRYAVEIVHILINYGVCVDHKDKYELTALHIAIYGQEKFDIIKIILDWFPRFNHRFWSVLFHKVVKLSLLNNDNIQYYTKILSALIFKGADVNSKDEHGRTALYRAVTEYNLSITELLINNGANIKSTIPGQSPIFWICEKSSSNIKDASFHEEMLDLLVSEGCDVNAMNQEGSTPLHLVTRNNNIILASKLLFLGANVNCRNLTEKRTPLHIVVKHGLLKMAILLLDYGADINSKDVYGNRPLHLVFIFNYSSDSKEILNMLLMRGALVNARNDQQRTALFEAILQMDGKSVEILLIYGADINDYCIDWNWWEDIESYSTAWLKFWIALNNVEVPFKLYTYHKEYNLEVHDIISKEIQELKSYFIVKRTSLYDWLRLPSNRQCNYYSNEKLQDIVHSSMLSEQFPLYCGFILGYYRKALTRKSIIESAKLTLIKLSKFYFPDICSEYIFDYLDDGDLINIIELYNCDIL